MNKHEKKNELLTGNNVILRLSRPSDYSFMRNILSDPLTMEHLKYMAHLPNGWTIEQVRERYKKYNEKSHNYKFTSDFIVELKGSGKVVGDCGFGNIDIDHRRAEFGIILDHSVWGTPVCTECHLLCLLYAYETLKFHRIEWTTSVDNIRMRQFLANINAEMESTRREYWIVDGHYKDDCVYVLFENQWLSVKEKLISILKRKSI